MPLLADRVRETSTTTGTGTLTLDGAAVGFQSFNTAFVNGATVYYCIQNGAEWEIGIGTVGTGTLARTTVLQSSNADALVPFSAGTKDVFCTYVADRAVTTSDAATLTNKTIDDYTNNVGANATHFRIKANENLTKGDVVKADGFTPGEAAIQVVKTAAASDVALGIVEQTLTTGSFGTAVTIGELFDVNTNGLTVGATIYSNGSGGYTTTKPSSGLYQPLGWIVRANTNNGVIAVNVVAPLYVEASTNTANTLVLRDGSNNFAAGTITAALTGNASTATTLQTARNINGVSFNGSADITVAAAAGTLTGTTLASNVVSSSLTSVGTLTSLSVSGSSQYTPVFTNSSTRAFVVSRSGAASSSANLVGFVIQNAAAASNAVTAGFYTGNDGASDLRVINAQTGAGVAIWTVNTERWNINSSGHLLASTDATYDIGASGATRPRNIYTSGDITVAGVRVGQGAGAVSTNTAVGLDALKVNTSGTTSVAVGAYALSAQTTGVRNTGLGYAAAAYVVSGSDVTAVGYQAGLNNTANNNTFVGSQAATANTSGAGNTAVGTLTLNANTTGASNTAVGANAMVTSTTAERCVAFGFDALRLATTGSYNVAVGFQAMRATTTGTENVAVGYSALTAATTGYANVAIGSLAGTTLTTTNSVVAVGYAAARFATGNYTTALGQDSVQNATGINNTGIGALALRDVTTGANNTAIGEESGYLITTGSKNSILGRYNGNQDGLDIRTSSNYAVISDGDGNRLLSMYNGGTLALDGGAVPQSGTGITFPATQSASSDANTLDDYEEGTWTPAYNTSNANMTNTVSSFGRYAKIGSVVHVWMRFEVSAISAAGTGTLRITGLPFICSTGNDYYGGISIGFAGNWTTTGAPSGGLFAQNDSYIRLTKRDSADARDRVYTDCAAADLQAAANFDYFYGCYRTN